jgi:tyrosine-protein phosphatase YwqE
LLPGIDDGAKHLRTACDLRERFRVGVTEIITTRISFSMSGIIPMKESHKKVETIQQLEKTTLFLSKPQQST